MNPVIFTSYFSQKVHPNNPDDPWVVGREADGRVASDSIKYIGPWYDSIHKLGLEGRVFYDNLSPEFIEEYETDKIKFVKCISTEYSNNDWRFFCYRNYLDEHKEWDAVFLTDGSDVTVVKNPADILTEYPDSDLFLCQDSMKLNEFPYMQFHMQNGLGDTLRFHLNKTTWELINMGVIGGSVDNVKEFLDIFCETRIRIGNPSFNSDMWTGQYVFRSLLKDKQLLIGGPFTSVFKGFENERNDVYFIHK